MDGVVSAASLWLTTMFFRGDDCTRKIGVIQVCLAVMLTCLVFVVKAAVLVPFGLRGFGVINLVYTDCAIILPLIGVGILILARRKVDKPSRVKVTPGVIVLCLLAIMAVPVSVYATFVEPFRLQLEETTIPLAGLEKEGEVTVCVLADLQFKRVTDYEINAVKKALSLKPDIICLPGDVFQGSGAEFDKNLADIQSLFAMLKAPGGVYLVQGDTDSPERLRRVVQGTNVTFLHNQIVFTEIRGINIAVGGTQLNYLDPVVVDMAKRLKQAAKRVDIALLVSHRPALAMRLENPSGVDLLIAGHTHGGQVQIPGVGPIMTASPIPNASAAGGLSDLNGTALYVSRGVGCERGQAPRLRLFCPPEISLLSLRAD